MRPFTTEASNWHRRWFDEDYLKLYAHRSPREAAVFIDLLQNRFGLVPEIGGSATLVLDLGCGDGRHLKELCRRGFRVVGLDWSPVLLRKGRSELGRALRGQRPAEEAAAQRPAGPGSGAFVRGDMRRPPFGPRFGWVLSLFSSFGYDERDEANEALLRRMSKLVAERGRLVIDYLNPPQLKKELVPLSLRTVDEWEVREERRIITELNMVEKRISFGRPAEAPRCVRERVKLYAHRWFVDRLEVEGFRLLAHLGDHEGGPWRESGPRSILVLRREVRPESSQA